MAHSTPQKPEGLNNGLGPSQHTGKTPPDILLIIFIHGFKGDATTFKEFPSRLQKILSENSQDLVVESIVSPSYETSGELKKAVENFSDWLTAETVQREIAHGAGSGSSRVKIVLCGHSMGGLLAADSIKEFIQARSEINAPLWPNVIACFGFDTPYLGLNLQACNNHVRKVIGKFAARFWSPLSYAVYALTGVALAVMAYLHLADIQYADALLDKDNLKERVRRLVEGETTHGVLFRTFYTLILPGPPTGRFPRRFCLLPEPSEDAFQHFVPARNTLAEDEVGAHGTMFEPTKNDGYDQLERETAAFIRQAITNGRLEVHTTPIDDQMKETGAGGIDQ